MVHVEVLSGPLVRFARRGQAVFPGEAIFPGERTAMASDRSKRRPPPVLSVILPPATPPEQPASMPRQSLTPVQILPRLPRLHRNSGLLPIAGPTHVA
jgi:hypothetical protein